MKQPTQSLPTKTVRVENGGLGGKARRPWCSSIVVDSGGIYPVLSLGTYRGIHCPAVSPKIWP